MNYMYCADLRNEVTSTIKLMVTCYRIESISDHKGIFHSITSPLNYWYQWFDKMREKHSNMPAAPSEFGIRFSKEHKCAFNSIEDLRLYVNKTELKKLCGKKYKFRVFKITVSNALEGSQTAFLEENIVSKIDITKTLL